MREKRSDRHRVSADRDVVPKGVTIRSIAGAELGRLGHVCPSRRRFDEHIRGSRPLLLGSLEVQITSIRRAHDDRIAADRNRCPEPGATVGGSQNGCLSHVSPTTRCLDENIGSAGRLDIRIEGSHDDCAAADSDGDAEPVLVISVRGRQLGQLHPRIRRRCVRGGGSDTHA